MITNRIKSTLPFAVVTAIIVMLAGAPGWVLSAIRPLRGFASLTKYSKVSRCRISNSAGPIGGSLTCRAPTRINCSLPTVRSLHGLAAGSAPL